MLKDHDSSAIVAVADLDRARAFYSDMLGLPLADEGAAQGVLVYRTGATRLIVYRSDHAGTNRANAANSGDTIPSSHRNSGDTISISLRIRPNPPPTPHSVLAYQTPEEYEQNG
ncbi:MAG: glyoxalase/bleomycin resistance/dioxygenase family protein [Alphaproteobacteria bacterium]|nr:glyoxalase/bleomycin resistance/dioxygenase family protein [Alphaproteobacteria bacterium]